MSVGVSYSGPALNLPNLITIARILLVPVVVWAIASGEMRGAFLLFLAAGITEAIPRWIVILVVFRDILIIGGIMLAWFLGKPITVRPLLVSKLNTVAQIVFAGLVLASLGFGFDAGVLQVLVMYTVAGLTLLSIGFYVREWTHHM